MEKLTGAVPEDHKVLLMLSGGRDSFLAACYLIEKGYHVQMITYNNGCTSNLVEAEKVADRIIEKYGSSRASFIGVRSIVASLYRMQEAYMYKDVQETSAAYPNLLPAQMGCLACKTGMYLESIAYCKVHDIRYIAEGARKVQKFFVELPQMAKQRYKELVQNNGIDLLLPVYDLEDDWERKLELSSRGYIPKTFELQCWIGCPMREELNADQIASLSAYYDKEMKPKLQDCIEKRINALSFERGQLEKEYCEI